MKRYCKEIDFNLEFMKASIYRCLNANNRWKREDFILTLAIYTRKYLVKTKRIRYDIFYLERKIKLLIKENKKEKLAVIVEYIALELRTEIKERKIYTPPIKYEKRYDSSSQKIRNIGILSAKQQLYDYITVDAMSRMLHAKLGYYQCAAIIGKGQVFGKQSIEYWIRVHPDKCKWIYKADVRHYYDSINHQVLLNFLKNDIKNDDLIYLLEYLIGTFGDIGLCIGSYLCQYLANYLMSYVYHYVQEELYIERRGKRIKLVNYILIYMDDVLFLGSSKKNVKMASKLFEKYVNEVLLLEIKPNFQFFQLGEQPIDMLGYIIWPDRTLVRRKVHLKANRTFRKVQREKYTMTIKTARRVTSYYGFYIRTNSNKYKRQVKLEKVVNNARRVISNDSKKRNISRYTTKIPISTQI